MYPSFSKNCSVTRYRKAITWVFNLNLLFIATLLSSANSTSSPCSNKTNFSPSTCSSLDRRCLANMLMVTTSMRMFYGVHGNTTYLRPAVALHLWLQFWINYEPEFKVNFRYEYISETRNSRLKHYFSYTKSSSGIFKNNSLLNGRVTLYLW